MVKVEIRRPHMKRLFIFGFALAFLLAGVVVSPVSAQTASASANCQKVKSQILSYQTKEKDFANQYAPVNGKWSWFFSSAHLNEYWLLQKKIVDYEASMFSYDLSNLSCFTIKQQGYAKVVSKEWNDLQIFLKGQPDWITGFNFTPIVWDSIYDKELVTPIP